MNSFIGITAFQLTAKTCLSDYQLLAHHRMLAFVTWYQGFGMINLQPTSESDCELSGRSCLLAVKDFLSYWQCSVMNNPK